MTQTPPNDPRFKPWPITLDAEGVRSRQIVLHGYLRAWRNVDAYITSPARRAVIRRFVALDRQETELAAERHVLRREIAAVRAMRVTLQTAHLEGRSPEERLEFFLEMYRAGRKAMRKAFPKSSRIGLRDPIQSSTPKIVLQSVDSSLRSLFRHSKHRLGESVATEILGATDRPWGCFSLIPDPRDDRLLWLERRADAAVLAAPADRAQPAPLGPWMLDELQQELKRVERHREIITKQWAAHLKTLERACDTAHEPMLKAAGATEHDAASFPVFLCVLRREEMMESFLQVSPQGLAPISPHDERLAAACRLARATPEFWWYALRGILFQAGAFGADGTPAPWVNDLLVLLLQHPHRLMRMKVPREAEKARTSLARRVAPLVHLTAQTAVAIKRIEDTDDSDARIAGTAMVLAACSKEADEGRDSKTIPPPSDLEVRAHGELLAETILPYAHSMMLSMSGVAVDWSMVSRMRKERRAKKSAERATAQSVDAMEADRAQPQSETTPAAGQPAASRMPASQPGPSRTTPSQPPPRPTAPSAPASPLAPVPPPAGPSTEGSPPAGPPRKRHGRPAAPPPKRRKVHTGPPSASADEPARDRRRRATVRPPGPRPALSRVRPAAVKIPSEHRLFVPEKKMPSDFGLGSLAKAIPPLDWTYVWHPEEPNGRTAHVGRAHASTEEAMAAFFLENAITILVKPRSVIHALQYFEGIPEEIRRMLPSETANGRRWFKLKRGGLRILVRTTRPGCAEFHLYPRREWSGPMEVRS